MIGMYFVRKFYYTARDGYQNVAIPVCVSQTWKNTEKCVMHFDETTSTLSITPLEDVSEQSYKYGE